MHRDVGVDDVGGVVATEQADLDHGHVDGDARRTSGSAAAVSELEVATGRRPASRLDRGDSADGGSPSCVVGDRLAVPGDALVDPLEVGAGVGADRQARARPAAR